MKSLIIEKEKPAENVFEKTTEKSTEKYEKNTIEPEKTFEKTAIKSVELPVQDYPKKGRIKKRKSALAD